ncbi:hypothetical protein INT47_007679 [Mucor saturninus]|uniref:Arrestin C-terminal-like domain-containing protein n=1 Tax=Mucor saturninus TaxID=64648 RepID=A0A8H7UTC6_9FUNG|nr:hypothetical protein INT47_007679 [Mucor saturninus]
MPMHLTLLPEFGWSINGQHVYGPGSVFQGFVTVKNMPSHSRITKIKLAFSCVETILPYTITPGIIRSTRKPIFLVAKILQCDSTASAKSSYTFPFTLQLPMLQFPPSVKQSYYQCEYKLVATAVDMNLPDKIEIPVVYMPFIETSLLKSSMLLNTTINKELAAAIKLYTLNFVPGDYLKANIKINMSTPEKKYKDMTVVTELKQLTTILEFHDVPDQVKTVCSQTQALAMTSKNTPSTTDIELLLPADLTPSFVGNLVSVSYTLHIRLEHKGSLSSIWKQALKVIKIQVVVGTLGYGIRSSDALESYTRWNDDSSVESPMPSPIFIDSIEYEDALPLYESIKLPCYEGPTQCSSN